MSLKAAPILRRVLERLGLREKSDHELGTTLEKLLILTTISMAAFIFLFVQGFLASGAPLSSVAVLILIGVVIDILPELWMYWIEFSAASPERQQLFQYHYALEGVAYVFLLLTFFPPFGVPTFVYYTLFMLSWAIAFLVGEAVILFLEDAGDAPDA